MLADQDTLEDYGMQEGAVVYCVVKPVASNYLLARLEDGTEVEVNFRPSDTVKKIKRIVAERAFGKRCKLSLVYNGTPMKDAKELREYQVKSKEEVSVIRSCA